MFYLEKFRDDDNNNICSETSQVGSGESKNIRQTLPLPHKGERLYLEQAI